MNKHRRGWWIAAGVGVLAAGIGSWLALRPARVPPRPERPDGVVTVGQAPLPPAQVPDIWRKAREQVAETLKKSPERLSPTAPLEPFNLASFEHDPEAYLSEIVPARCNQTAKPGPDTPVLDVAGPLRTHVTHGSDVLLWVKTVPNAPVTFTVFGGGYFKENGVGTVSVRADARGLAGAHYTADAGIEGDVSVIAGSPLAAGTQRFYIRVEAARPATAKL